MRRCLLLLLLLAGTPVARAEERFLIARIDVRDLVHASADVIRSESRLREGVTYGESELREASDRIRRLPFVLDTSFRLERGAVHGEHVLVISVKETKPLFYHFELVPHLQSRNVLGFVGNDSLLGVRWFAGRRDVLHAAAFSHESDRPFESSYLALQAGYTRYGLFDDRAFATLTVSRFAPRESSGNIGSTLPGALVGVSLTPNHTLTISYRGVDSGAARRRAERVLESRLAYNTTNHPYFPSNGVVLSLAPVMSWVDAIDRVGIAAHDFDLALDGRAAKYWTLAERYTASAAIVGGAVRVEQRRLGDERTFAFGYASMAMSVARTLGEPDPYSARRLELSLRAGTRHHEVVPLLPDNAHAQTSLTWVRRDEWGVLRFGLGYVW